MSARTQGTPWILEELPMGDGDVTTDVHALVS